MKLVIDACVLYPSVMREVVLGVAETGLFTPIWSQRLLEEWHRAALRHSPKQGAEAQGEIALLGLRFPNARCEMGEEAQFWLPDPNDIHVLALAVEQGAQGILTLNEKDFPRKILAEYGLARLHPDAYLSQAFTANPARILPVLTRVYDRAVAMGADGLDLNKILKKARLPRLAKAVRMHK